MIPKLIHIYWDSEEIPKSLELIIDNIKRKNKDFKVCIYSEKDIPFKFEKNEKIGPQFKADIFRMYILYKLGGVYLDISCIFFDNLKKIINLSDDRIQGYSIPGEPGFPTEKMDDFTLENWFLVSNKGNPFMYYWLLQLLLSYELGFTNYVFLHRNLLNDYFKPRLPYMMMHFAYHVTCENLGIPVNKNNKYIKIIGVSNAKYNPFFIHDKYNWNKYKVINNLLNRSHMKGIGVFIKLIGSFRKYYMKCIEEGRYNPNSILGKALEL
jgi:hypothetical protein